MAEAGDPFSALRVANLVARLPRGVPVPLRDVVERLNADYLDWSFSRSVVAWVGGPDAGQLAGRLSLGTRLPGR